VVDLRGNTAGLVLKESLPIGFTYYTRYEINQIIDRFGAFWYGCNYDPFTSNCNHFTERMISHICDQEFYYPTYINRFTKLGSILRMWFKPLQEIVGNIVNYDEKEDANSAHQNYMMVLEGKSSMIEIHRRSQDEILPPIVNRLVIEKVQEVEIEDPEQARKVEMSAQ
jgi:hypothetical protein